MFVVGKYYRHPYGSNAFKYNKTCWSEIYWDGWAWCTRDHHSLDYLETEGFVPCDRKGRLIKKIKEEDMDKNFSGKYTHIVKVKFSNGAKIYQYKTNITDLVKGDRVVVDSSTGYGIAKVTEVFEDSFDNAEKNLTASAWVVQKVDLAAHKKRIDMHKKRKYILRKMKEKQEQIQETQIYAILAKEDDEMAKLLSDLTDIDS